jgi:tetratricopeptide (TPR) repeat protein
MNFPYYALPLRTNEFVKRSQELEAIKEIFSNVSELAICGLGGTGKTVLAVSFIEYAILEFPNVRWFNGPFFEIEYKEFAQDFLGVDVLENRSLKSIIQTVNTKLKRLEMNVLLIIDNLREYEILSEYTQGLANTNVKILVTTRNEDIPISKIYLYYLEPKEACSFLNEYKTLYASEFNHGHIDAIVKKTRPTPLHLRISLCFLKEFKLNPFEDWEIFSFLEANFKNTFILLQYCSLLDSSFISVNFLVELFKNSSYDINLKQAINQLHRLALADALYSDQGINGIRLNESTQIDVLKYQKNNFINEIAFCINSFFKLVNEEQSNWLSTKTYFIHASFISKHDDFCKLNRDLAAELLNKLVNYELYIRFDLKKSLDYSLKCFEIENDIAEKNDTQIIKMGNTLNKIADIYSLLEDHAKSFEYDLKCYEVRKNLLENTENVELRALIIESLINLGKSFAKNNCLENSFQCLETTFQCLKLQSSLNEKNHTQIVETLMMIALNYSGQNCHTKSLEYKLKASDICKKFDLDQLLQAECLYSIGVSYENLKMHENALTYYVESYELRKIVFSNRENLKLADSLFSIANCYSHLNDLEKSLEKDIECLEMRKKIYGLEDPKVADSFYNIAVTYRKLGDKNKALQFFLDCYNLRLKENKYPELNKLDKIIKILKESL